MYAHTPTIEIKTLQDATIMLSLLERFNCALVKERLPFRNILWCTKQSRKPTKEPMMWNTRNHEQSHFQKWHLLRGRGSASLFHSSDSTWCRCWMCTCRFFNDFLFSYSYTLHCHSQHRGYLSQLEWSKVSTCNGSILEVFLMLALIMGDVAEKSLFFRPIPGS